MTVSGTTTVGGASTGQITLAAASLANSVTLTLGGGAGTVISTGTITGPASAPVANLTINTTSGAVSTIGGVVGTNIGTVTVTNLGTGGLTFSNTVSATTVAFAGTISTTGTGTFSNTLTAGTLTAAAGGAAYNIALNGGGTVTAAVSFLNTGTLTIGAGFTFTNGASKIVGAKSLNGTISATASALNFGTAGNVSLAGATTLNATSGVITLFDIPVAANANLVMQGSGADVLGVVNLGTGTLDLSGMTGGSVTAGGLVSAAALTTVGNNYAIALNGGGTVTGAVSFLNTGTLTIGAGFTFTNGASKIVGAKSLNGTISATASALNFGTAGNVSLAGNTTLNATSGVITLFDIPVAANANLVMQGSGADVLGVVNLGTGTLDLSGMTAGGSVTVGGLVSAAALTTTNVAYNVALNGGGTVSGAVTFSNTGTLTLGGAWAFTAGVNASGVTGGITLAAGSVTAAGVGVINLGSAGGVAVSGTTTVGGASTGQITLAAANLANSVTLTLGGGAGTVISTGTITGPVSRRWRM